jgi:hypothetical protein
VGARRRLVLGLGLGVSHERHRRFGVQAACISSSCSTWVGAAADLARDGEDGTLPANTLRRLHMESAVGAVGSLRVLGCFDQCPAQGGRAVLGEPAAALRPARLVDVRVEACGADRLAGTLEARRLTELGQQVAGQDRPDTVDRLQGHAAPIGAGEATQFCLSGRSSLSTRLDQTQ